MKKEIIKTENYLLVVDDSEIKEKSDDWFYSFETNKIYDAKTFYPTINCKRIIAHLPLNPPFIYGYTNSPILKGVDLLPPLEDEFEYISNEYYKVTDVEELNGELLAVYKAIKKTKEKYKYTEEDLSKALSYGYHTAKDEAKGIPSSGYFTRFIQSLQQPKMPVEFKCEIEYIGFQDEGDLEVPKSFINSQGLTQWVGEYIY